MVVGDAFDPALNDRQRRLRARLRRAMEAARGSCETFIAATARLPLGELDLTQRRQLRSALREAAQKAKAAAARGFLAKGIDPALTALALAESLP